MSTLILLPVVIFAAAIGLFLVFRSDSAIEFQRIFYEKINWRIEPVSMEKEIRNTRIMGIALILAAMAATSYSVLKG